MLPLTPANDVSENVTKGSLDMIALYSGIRIRTSYVTNLFYNEFWPIKRYKPRNVLFRPDFFFKCQNKLFVLLIPLIFISDYGQSNRARKR